jgi:hypothetical protein
LLVVPKHGVVLLLLLLWEVFLPLWRNIFLQGYAMLLLLALLLPLSLQSLLLLLLPCSLPLACFP